MDNLRRGVVWRSGFDLRLRRPVCAHANPGRHAHSDGCCDSCSHPNGSHDGANHRANADSYACPHPQPDGCRDPYAHTVAHSNRYSCADARFRPHANACPHSRTNA